jgi:Dolichyl-phosphate-mannose-protein mannosyltransferase
MTASPADGAAFPSANASRAARNWDVLAIAGLLMLGVVLPFAIAAVAGSLEIPRHDDWAYRLLALDFARTGILQLDVTTMIVGQILVTQPLLWLSGLQPSAFAAAGVIFASCAVLSAYALARQFLPPVRATLAVSLLLLFPGYLAYATSFMSDVPALAAQFSCLALAVVALGRRPVRERWLLGSVIVGCIGISFRDFALAAPAAVVVAAICSEPRRWRFWGLAVTVAGYYGLLYLLRISSRTSAPAAASGSLAQSVDALGIVALVLAPAILIGAVNWRRFWHRRDLVIGADLGGLLAVSRLLQWHQPGPPLKATLGNLFSQWGTPDQGMFLGDRPRLFDNGMWTIVNSLALAAGILMLAVVSGIAGAWLRRCRRSHGGLISSLGSPSGLLAVFAVAVAAGLAMYGQFNSVYDRYYWPVVPPIAVLLIHGSRSSTPIWPAWRVLTNRVLAASAVLLVAVLASTSLIYALNSNAFDTALWRAGQVLARSGVRSDEIDAGYSWVGFYASTPATGGGPSTPFYREYWPAFRQCAFVTSDEATQPGTTLVGTTSYSLYLIAGPAEPLYLFRDAGPDCQRN